MKHNRFIWILTLLAIIGCNSNGPTTVQQHQAKPGISGDWMSEEFGGSDIGNHIRKVEFVFKPGGSFTVTAEITDNDVQSFDGTYKVLPSALELTIPEKETKRLSYTLSKDVLTVKDPDLDSWIKFRRKDLTEQGAPTGADKPRR